MKTFQDLSITDYFKIIRRRIWYVLITAVLVSAGTAAYVWRLPSLYKSETTIMVASRLLPEDYIGSLIRESATDRVDFVRQQLRSRSFVERIIQEFQLDGGQSGNMEGLVNSVLLNTEINVVSASTFKVAYTATTPDRAQSITRRLAERVLALNDTNRRDKVYAADQFLDDQVRQAANELTAAEDKVRQFNGQNFPSMPQDQVVGIEAVNDLERQLATITADLEPVTNQRTFLARRLEEQRQLKMVVQATATSPRSLPQTRQLQPPPQDALQGSTALDKTLATKRAELNAAASRYTPLHPDVVRLTREVQDLVAQIATQPRLPQQPTTARTVDDAQDVVGLPEIDQSDDLIAAEMQIELEQLDRTIASRQQTQNDLSRRIGLFRRRLNLPPQLAEQLTVLTRDVDAARQRYSYLSSKKVNSELAGSVDTSENNALFKIIDPANLPQRASWPDRPTLLILGCLAGLGLGFGVAFIRDFANGTFSDEDEMSDQLKLPTLASIPNVSAGESKKPFSAGKPNLTIIPTHISPEEGPIFSLYAADSKIKRVVLDSSMTMAGEQFRLVRTSLSAMQQKNGLKRILITSAIPNEGKTFVASCLSGMLAQETDKSVLLVHADMRKTNSSQLLGNSPSRSVRGLSEVLTGSVSAEDALLKCAEVNLYLLAAGAPVNNPTELLCLPQFESLIRDFSRRFDWIIIDSPPTLALADANILMPVCDAALIVVRAEKTPATLVKDSIQRVGRERICGVLLNGAQNIKSSQYYKHYYRQILSMKQR